MPELSIGPGDQAAVITARGAVRELARAVGFGVVDQTRLTTAVSEIVRNVVLYAHSGTVTFVVKEGSSGRTIEVVVEDEGPGIDDVAMVLEGGVSTSGGFGRGIPGARALVDDFRLVSVPGSGTRVELRKWV